MSLCSEECFRWEKAVKGMEEGWGVWENHIIKLGHIMKEPAGTSSRRLNDLNQQHLT